jgi:Endopolygalacturonase
MAAKDYLAADFGAVADGKTLNTASLQAAIDFASSNGGGRVVLTAGNYVSGSIYLKNDVTLHLEAGATLLGSLNPWDYVKDPYIKWTAFIFGVKQNNIGLTGKGTVDCRGFEVATRGVDYAQRGLIADKLVLARLQEQNRPQNIHFRECTNVTVKDVTLKNPACWNQQYELCNNLLIEGITVDAKAYWNNDGLDVVDCCNVIVRDCFIDSSDDAYCFKSHHRDGLSENILVENCVGRSSANGIKFGTMTAGTFKHFRFKNMTIFDTYRSAITIACVDGGIVEDVEVDGLKSIHTGNPIFIRAGLRNKHSLVPTLKDLTIKNFYAEVPAGKADAGYNYEGPIEDLPRNCCASGIQGIPELRIQNVKLENVEIRYPGNANPRYAFRGCTDADLDAIPELQKSYPEFSNWKELPSWGFYVRHTDGLEMKNVKISVDAPDYRPAIVMDDVTDLVMDGISIDDKASDASKKNIVLKDTTEKTK